MCRYTVIVHKMFSQCTDSQSITPSSAYFLGNVLIKCNEAILSHKKLYCHKRAYAGMNVFMEACPCLLPTTHF